MKQEQNFTETSSDQIIKDTVSPPLPPLEHPKKSKTWIGTRSWFVVMFTPHILYLLLYLVNMSLRGDEYCPAPTFFEAEHGGVMLLALIAIKLFAYLQTVPAAIIISFTGVFLIIKSIFRKDIRTVAKRRFFLGLPFTIFIGGIISVSLLIEILSGAGEKGEEVSLFLESHISYVIILLLATAVIYLLVVGIKEKMSLNPVLKKQSTITLVAALLGLGASYMFFLPDVFTFADSMNNPYRYVAHDYKNLVYSNDNYRMNINNCYLPQSKYIKDMPDYNTMNKSWFVSNGYDFTTGNVANCIGVYCMSHEAVIIPDSFSKKDEYFISLKHDISFKSEQLDKTQEDVILYSDINVSIVSDDYKIRTVYGSPGLDYEHGEMLRFHELKPLRFANSKGFNKVTLAHLEKVANTGKPSYLIVSYTDSQGMSHTNEQLITWSDEMGTKISTSIRKEVLLARFGNLIFNWIVDENMRSSYNYVVDNYSIKPPLFTQNGIPIVSERQQKYTTQNFGAYEVSEELHYNKLNDDVWLVVSDDYAQIFKEFMVYFVEESKDLSDQELLKQEIQLLQNLTNAQRP